jgi:hypothetical protein
MPDSSDPKSDPVHSTNPELQLNNQRPLHGLLQSDNTQIHFVCLTLKNLNDSFLYIYGAIPAKHRPIAAVKEPLGFEGMKQKPTSGERQRD